MPKGSRSKSRSRSQKRTAGLGGSAGMQAMMCTCMSAQNQAMICTCIPIHQQGCACMCGPSSNQQGAKDRSRSRKGSKAAKLLSSTRIDYSDLNGSVYETALDETLLEVADDEMNASKLGLMYRTGSFR